MGYVSFREGSCLKIPTQTKEWREQGWKTYRFLSSLGKPLQITDIYIKGFHPKSFERSNFHFHQNQSEPGPQKPGRISKKQSWWMTGLWNNGLWTHPFINAYILPETNTQHLKMEAPEKETIVFQKSICRGYVSFREGKISYNWVVVQPKTNPQNIYQIQRPHLVPLTTGVTSWAYETGNDIADGKKKSGVNLTILEVGSECMWMSYYLRPPPEN